MFDVVDEKLMCLYGSVASQALTNARRGRRLRDTVAQLERALVSRSQIDQAKGALRAVNACTAEEAFALLTERSQRRNVKLRVVAGQVLDELTRTLSS